MYVQFVQAVLRKAIAPMQGLAEAMLLLVSLALPAIAALVGVPTPSDDSVLAYLGMVLVVLVVLRLFFVAPYQVWREQVGEIGTLKLELDEPERREIAHMATIRAEKRLELAAAIRELHWTAFTEIGGGKKEVINAAYGRALALMGQAGVPESFDKAFGRFTGACTAMYRARAAGNDPTGNESIELMENMTAFLHGRMTAEQLALKLAEKPEEPELPLGPVMNALAGPAPEGAPREEAPKNNPPE